MPPQHPQTGDILDRALHAARTQTPPHVAANPKLTPNEKGFFGAVAGERSPLNRQSSRIAKPFANQTYLGDQSQATVATPAQQAFLALDPAKKGNREARTIEQEYVKGADTRTTVAKREPTGRGGPGGPITYAQTAPNIAAVGQRALGLIGGGIPLGTAAPAALQALAKMHLSGAQRQQVIGGFAHDTTLDEPTAKAAEVALALAKGHSLPANPTKRQLLTAALEPKEHKPSYWDIIPNLPKDILYTPVYAAEGGYALGHATRAAAGGNPNELEAIGNSQLQTFMHPGAFVQQHPFQAALTALGAAKGVGSVGKLTNIVETPRVVPGNADFGSIPIERGTLSKNLTTRLGQKTSDAVLARSKPLQRRAYEAKGRQIHNLSRIDQAHNLRANLEPLLDASKNLSRREQGARLYNEGQGAPAEEFSSMYDQLATANKAAGKRAIPKTQRAQAKLRAAQSERFGAPDENAQAFLDAAGTASKGRTDMLLNMKTPSGNAALDPVSAKWRDYQHLVGLRAEQGDTLAQAVKSARDRSQSTQIGTDEHAAAYADLSKALDAFANSTDAKPFRVPTVRPKPISEFNFPGKSVRANKDLKAMVTGLGKPSSGQAFESGNFPHDPAHFYRQLAEPHTAAATIDYVNRVSKEIGRKAVPGEEIPAEAVLRPEKNLRATPKVKVSAEDSLNADADALKAVHEEFIDPHENGLTHVPANFKGVILPRPVYDQISSAVARVDPKSFEAKLGKATRAYKNSVLFTRFAYPAGNFTNSALQAGFGGAGGLSFLRRNALPLPAGVEDAGLIAREFERTGKLGFKSGLDEAKVAPSIPGKAGAIAKGVGRFAKDQTLDRNKQLSIAADNVWRKALYVNKALPEARKIAYPDDGAIRRLLVRRKASDSAIQEAARQMAEGETPAAKLAADKALKITNDFLNDFGAMKRYKTLDLAVPFNSWTRFSAKLLLQTLPLNYPGRTLLLYRLGQLGEQGTGQQGVLPQYLQENIPLGKDNPLSQLEAYTQRANPFATLGTTFPPQENNGNVDTKALPGLLSPFVGIGLNAAYGKDLSQNSRDLVNAKGEPITENPADQLRYIASQIGGLVPPLGVATGGGRGKADTSIPIPGLTEERKKNNAGPLLQQPEGPTVDLPFIGKVPVLPFVNMLAPIRIDVRNAHADQVNGANALQKYLSSKQQADNKAALAKPGGQAAVVEKWTKIGDEVNKHLTYYLKNPKAVDALIASGAPARETR